MKRLLLGSTTALLLAAGAALAVEPTLGTRLGTTIGEIAAALEAEGYSVTKFERDDGRIEVTALRDDRRIELYIDPASGEVVKLEAGLRRGAPAGAGTAVDDAAIRTMLEGQGYSIVKYEREGGRIEVKATKDGRRWEIYIDAVTGQILSTREDS